MARGMVIVVMGVAGSGKTTVGRQLAGQLGWAFHDADDLHAPSSVERMRRGEPLTDDDRAPWLASLATLIGEHVRQRRPMVLACSALSRAHRTALTSRAPEPGDVGFVHLRADATLLGERLARRVGHFFPPDLLADQLATLEEPEPNAAAAAGPGPIIIALDASRAVGDLVADIRAAFGL